MKVQVTNVEKFDQLYEFWKKVGLQVYPYEEEKVRFESMLRLNPELCFDLINEAGVIVGTILGGFDGRTASVHRLAIDPTLQKKGNGSMLINKLESVLKKKGVKKISAQIHISNTQVLEFYKKIGYQDMNYVVTVYKDL